MKEKQLPFDHKKHICYSQLVKRVIHHYLSARCDKEKADALWESIQIKYVEFLRDLPALGGKKNRHNGTGGTYDCIMLFALYECSEEKPSVQELYEMNNELFLPPFRKLGKFVNCNGPLYQRMMQLAFEQTAKTDSAHVKDWPGNYVMRVHPYDKAAGIRYEFTRCPIADFARAHEYLHLMPAFCNGDYPAMEALHEKLIRTRTCANGEVCDYQIVGDANPLLAEHPRKMDEQGFWWNEP